MMQTWYITTLEDKNKFWDAYPYMMIGYTRKLPDPRTCDHYEWKMPLPIKPCLKLVTEDNDMPQAQEIKYIRFHKTRVIFAIDNEPLERLFIWVQKDLG